MTIFELLDDYRSRLDEDIKDTREALDWFPGDTDFLVKDLNDLRLRRRELSKFKNSLLNRTMPETV